MGAMGCNKPAPALNRTPGFLTRLDPYGNGRAKIAAVAVSIALRQDLSAARAQVIIASPAQIWT
jgi:hypothetical protein